MCNASEHKKSGSQVVEKSRNVNSNERATSRHKNRISRKSWKFFMRRQTWPSHRYMVKRVPKYAHTHASVYRYTQTCIHTYIQIRLTVRAVDWLVGRLFQIIEIPKRHKSVYTRMYAFASKSKSKSFKALAVRIYWWSKELEQGVRM